MKRFIISFAFTLTLGLTSIYADQVFIEPFSPVTPEILGEGGAWVATAHGYNALFTNPAGFSRKGGDTTFLSIQTNPYVPVTQLNRAIANIPGLMAAFNNPLAGGSGVDLINDLLTKYGVGVQSTVGMGWVGGNLGVGFAVDEKFFAKGPNLLGTAGTLDVTEGIVIGYSMPVDLKFTTLNLGLSVRPMQRTYGDVLVTDMMGGYSKIMNTNVYNGFGLGWDFGAMADIGQFTLGFAMRDIGSTTFNFESHTIQDVYTSFSFPKSSNSPAPDFYRVPMSIDTGVAWHPDMGTYKILFDPTIQLDLQIPLKDQFTQPSFWTWVHLGAEAKFLSFLSIRTGLNQGYFTLGFGAKMVFVDLNLAIYSQELGRFSGLNKRSGVLLELAFRI